MQAIAGSVGDGGTNTGSDVALIQVMLMKVQQAGGRGPYLTSYDGASGPGTIAAIRQFKIDQNVEPQTPAAAVRGVIQPDDATWRRLAAMVPQDFQGLRVLPAGKTVYLEATTQQRDAKITNAATFTFAPAFRVKINNLINRMHAVHGIAVGVCPQGGRRSFQEQYELFTSGRGVTNAGPGESNHNFGMAADIGFAGLRWLRSDGTVVENEGHWLGQMHRVSAEQELKFWDALRAVGTSNAVGAYRGPAGDRPHLQNWSDAGVSMARGLAAHLTRSGTMHWERAGRVYQSDLGFGGVLYPVGTAAQIWAGNATIDAATLTRARAAARPRAAALPAAARQPAGLAVQGAPARAAAVPAAAGQPAQATAEDVAAMRRALRAEFERADRNWSAWLPS
jgi:hypothetical protein